MTIDEIELYDVEAVDEILSHLSDEDAKTITEYETKRIPGCIQDIAPNKKWSNIL